MTLTWTQADPGNAHTAFSRRDRPRTRETSLTNDDLHFIARQERDLRFDSFSEDDAWRLGCLLRDQAAEQRWPVVIDVRRFDRPLFLAALAGSVPDNAEWVRRKSNVVARFHRSSYGFGLHLKHDGVTLESRYGLSLSDYAPHGGSFPLWVKGAGPIGSVTVSGLPQRGDHAAVTGALRRMLGMDPAAYALGPSA